MPLGEYKIGINLHEKRGQSVLLNLNGLSMVTVFSTSFRLTGGEMGVIKKIKNALRYPTGGLPPRSLSISTPPIAELTQLKTHCALKCVRGFSNLLSHPLLRTFRSHTFLLMIDKYPYKILTLFILSESRISRFFHAKKINF